MNFPILSSLILLPTIGALFLFFTKDERRETTQQQNMYLFLLHL